MIIRQIAFHCILFVCDLLTVRLIEPPVIIEGPGNQTATVGDDVTLTCRYYSDAEALVYWTRRKDDVIDTALLDTSEMYGTNKSADEGFVALQVPACAVPVSYKIVRAKYRIFRHSDTGITRRLIHKGMVYSHVLRRSRYMYWLDNRHGTVL